jgi:hypothetical protein
MSTESNLKLATYFDSRAKRARNPDERERLLMVARKYRDKAKEDAAGEPIKAPPTHAKL